MKARARADLVERFGGDDIFDDVHDIALALSRADVIAATVDAPAKSRESAIRAMLEVAQKEGADARRLVRLVFARMVRDQAWPEAVEITNLILSQRVARRIEDLDVWLLGVRREELVFADVADDGRPSAKADAAQPAPTSSANSNHSKTFPADAAGDLSLEPLDPSALEAFRDQIAGAAVAATRLTDAFSRGHASAAREVMLRANRRLGETLVAACEQATVFVECMTGPRRDDADPFTPEQLKGLGAAVDHVRALAERARALGVEDQAKARLDRIFACINDDALDDVLLDAEGCENEDTPSVQRAEACARVIAACESPSAAEQFRRRVRAIRGLPAPQELLFQPLEWLAISDRAPPRLGRFQRGQLDTLWSWAVSHAPDIISQVERVSAENPYLDPSDPQLVAERRALGELIGSHPDLAQLLDAPTRALIGELLRHDSDLARMTADWPFDAPLADLAPRHATAIQRVMDELIEHTPEAGPFLMVALAARLAKPSEIFRALGLVARSNSDVFVENTDFAIVGDVVLDEAELVSQAFQRPDAKDFDMDAAREALGPYSHLVAGMTEEFVIRQGGRWGERLFPLRSQAARNLESICRRAQNAIEDATPQSRMGAARLLRPDVSRPVDTARMERAVSGAQFLSEARSHDGRAAFAAMRSQVAKVVEARLRQHEDLLLDALRDRDPQARQSASDHLIAFADLVRVFDGDETAGVLIRRAELAIAAA